MYETTYHYDATSTAQIASSTTVLSTSTPAIATTSDIVILPQMDAGQVLIIFLLFVLVLLQMLGMVLRALDRARTRKQIMGYSGGDVEIRDDL